MSQFITQTKFYLNLNLIKNAINSLLKSSFEEDTSINIDGSNITYKNIQLNTLEVNDHILKITGSVYINYSDLPAVTISFTHYCSIKIDKHMKITLQELDFSFSTPNFLLFLPIKVLQGIVKPFIFKNYQESMKEVENYIQKQLEELTNQISQPIKVNEKNIQILPEELLLCENLIKGKAEKLYIHCDIGFKVSCSEKVLPLVNFSDVKVAFMDIEVWKHEENEFGNLSIKLNGDIL